MATRPSTIGAQFEQLIRQVTSDRPARAPRHGAGRRRPVQHEKFEQNGGVKLLRSIGATVYTFGTRRSRGTRCTKCGEFVPNPDQGTRQSAGVPDVLAFMPRPRIASVERRHILWWEVKRPGGGAASDEQLQFRALCSETSTLHCLGDINELIAFLIHCGYLKPANVAHYRQPATTTESAPCAGHSRPMFTTAKREPFMKGGRR